MASPEILDDLWERGLAALISTENVPAGTRERMVRRVGVRRRRRAGLQGTAVLALVVVAATAFAFARTSRDARPAERPRAATLVRVTLNGLTLTVTPESVSKGRIQVSFRDLRPSRQTVLKVANTGVQVPSGEVRSIVLPRDGNYGLLVSRTPAIISHGPPPPTPALRVFTPPAGAAVATRRFRIPAGQLALQPTTLHAPAGIVELQVHDVGAGQHMIAVSGVPGF
ncbi:MAG: hypothetical protein JWL83_2576, partial [Actinomycetia bacterium]|nr:hypothetical protein [Actinomycetes bacterium]